MLKEYNIIDQKIDSGIVNSLEFLKIEADKLENKNLSMILSVAGKLASHEIPLNEFEEMVELPDDDTTKAAMFVAKFLNASESSQHKLFKVLAE